MFFCARPPLLAGQGGRTFLSEWCFHHVDVHPYDGGEYDSVIPVGNDSLLLTYAVSTTPFDMRIVGTLIRVAPTRHEP